MAPPNTHAHSAERVISRRIGRAINGQTLLAVGFRRRRCAIVTAVGGSERRNQVGQLGSATIDHCVCIVRAAGAARLGGSVPMQSLGKVPFKGKAAAVEISQ